VNFLATFFKAPSALFLFEKEPYPSHRLQLDLASAYQEGDLDGESSACPTVPS
jgi:hypothetical protein